ncbi:hypothetical protein [Chromobacterium violaceum]|uniref:hypothetical protein n=1 Tax=Chromobacterium violaceum TaxID=536 RepID=UPI003DA7CDD9
MGRRPLPLAAKLQGRDLTLTLNAKAPGRVELLRQPAAAMGKGLLLPLAEGSYIPAGSKLWRDFLHGFAGDGLDTSENLSLPLWGMDYGRRSLHWLLLEPFNNQLAIRADGSNLALGLSHEFNPLNQQRPMTLLLRLADDNLLAGAQRYRQWLIEQGRYQTLADKIQAQPDTAKLIGASHVYLWGKICWMCPTCATGPPLSSCCADRTRWRPGCAAVSTPRPARFCVRPAPSRTITSNAR